MNERIKLLALEAALGCIDPNGPYTAEEFIAFQEKFAELIVSKCIELMDENYRGDMYTGDVYDSEYNNCINEQVETLQDYFGVNK
jgi:hypothetical protein